MPVAAVRRCWAALAPGLTAAGVRLPLLIIIPTRPQNQIPEKAATMDLAGMEAMMAPPIQDPVVEVAIAAAADRHGCENEDRCRLFGGGGR